MKKSEEGEQPVVGEKAADRVVGPVPGFLLIVGKGRHTLSTYITWRKGHGSDPGDRAAFFGKYDFKTQVKEYVGAVTP